MKIFLELLLAFLVLTFTLMGCEGGVGPTPPIAGPSANSPAPSSVSTTQLPLHLLSSPSSATGGTSPNSADSSSTITAVPALIYVLSSGKTAESTITVQKGVFPANAVVTIWGETSQPAKTTTSKGEVEVEKTAMYGSGLLAVPGINITQVTLSSPPSILGADLDTSTPDIQMHASSDGALSLTLLAGNSPGTFVIHVAYATGGLDLKTTIIISK